MPLYVFKCGGCGPFELVSPMGRAGATADCPACGNGAQRVFTPPGLTRLAAPARRALDLEEKSAHEPGVVAEKLGRPLPHTHAPTPPWTLGH